jgi:hypothetical protein
MRFKFHPRVHWLTGRRARGKPQALKSTCKLEVFNVAASSGPNLVDPRWNRGA